MTESLSYHCLSAIPQYKIKSFFFFFKYECWDEKWPFKVREKMETKDTRVI